MKNNGKYRTIFLFIYFMFFILLFSVLCTHPSLSPKMSPFTDAVILFLLVASLSLSPHLIILLDTERSVLKLLFLKSCSQVKRGSMWILLHEKCMNKCVVLKALSLTNALNRSPPLLTRHHHGSKFMVLSWSCI